MARPTKEEVVVLKQRFKDIEEKPCWANIDEAIDVFDAYLEQMEELSKIEKQNIGNDELVNTMSINIHELRQEVKQLQTEKESLESELKYLKGGW